MGTNKKEDSGFLKRRKILAGLNSKSSSMVKIISLFPMVGTAIKKAKTKD